MDVYVECMVERKVSAAQKIMRNIWVAICVITGLAAFFLDVIFALLFLVSLFLTKMFSNRMAMMYEYTYLNGDITFSRMTTNRRKKLFSCTMERVDEVCPYKEYHAPGIKFSSTKDFASGSVSDRLYVMTVSGEKGKVKIYFEPNDEMLDAMWRMAPRTVKKKR